MSQSTTTQAILSAYFSTLENLLQNTRVTAASGSELPLGEGIDGMRERANQAHGSGNKIMFVGNGGSAAIASHCAIDYSKNGNLRSMAFNDPAALTCLSNDLGYENVFAKQVDLHGRKGDLLVAISSSGNSVNITHAVKTALEKECQVITLSGFSGDNALRRTGHLNFYVNSMEYGFVELAHLTLCHAALDLNMGWSG